MWHPRVGNINHAMGARNNSYLCSCALLDLSPSASDIGLQISSDQLLEIDHHDYVQLKYWRSHDISDITMIYGDHCSGRGIVTAVCRGFLRQIFTWLIQSWFHLRFSSNQQPPKKPRGCTPKLEVSTVALDPNSQFAKINTDCTSDCTSDCTKFVWQVPQWLATPNSILRVSSPGSHQQIPPP